MDIIDYEFDDDYDDGTAVLEDPFIWKVFINILRGYQPSFQYGSVVERIFSVYGFLPSDIKAEIDEKKKTYNTDRNDKFSFFSEIFSEKDISSYRKRIEQSKENVLKTTWEESISGNSVILSELMDLNDIEKKMLHLALFLTDKRSSYAIKDVFGMLANIDIFKDNVCLYSVMFDEPVIEVQSSFDKFLVKSSIVSSKGQIQGIYTLKKEFADKFIYTRLTTANIKNILFPNNLSTKLNIELFDHLSEDIKLVEGSINNSLNSNLVGSNIMFWGEPGTGKTELAQVLAKKNGWNLIVIGENSDDDNEEKSRSMRLASLKIAQKLFKNHERVVLLFDEMEDVFPNPSEGKVSPNESFSKSFINRTIESTNIPIIWTTNDLYTLGKATLRRMLYNIKFTVPDYKTRKKIWDNYISEHQLTIDDKLVDKFAFKYDMAPALIANAVKVAKMSGSNDFEKILKKLDILINFGRERKFDDYDDEELIYDPSCSNSDICLELLVEKLKKAKPNFNICLFGPSGTGKTEFARHLTKSLNKLPLLKSGSDIISPYVGGTEQNIANVFESAKNDEKVLILDEGDSFLRDRKMAKNSWEITQVNELLNKMENHSQPFILTTNLMDDIDSAALRRFTFKIKFDFMKPEQISKLFRKYFNMEAPESILNIQNATPGDLKLVYDKASILEINDVNIIGNMIIEECKFKPEQPSKRYIL